MISEALCILVVFATHDPGDCSNFHIDACHTSRLCIWDCMESKCVQTSDANSACNPPMSPMMGAQPYGAAPMMPGQMPMNTMGHPGVYGTSPYGAAGMQPGYPQPGMQPGYPQNGVPQTGYPGTPAVAGVNPTTQTGMTQPGYPQAGVPPAAGAYPAQQPAGYGAPGYGAAPATGYGAAAPYNAGIPQPGLNSAYPGAVRPGFGAAAAPMPPPAATGFGHGAYAPVHPMLRSIRRSNTTLSHAAYGAYPAATVPGAYPQTYPGRAGTYPRSGVYPATGAYGAYGTNSKNRGIATRGVGTNTNYYGWQAPKTKKYNMSTTFSYALMIVTPFLILCSFCVGKFVGAKSSLDNATPGGHIISNPDLMQPIHLEPTSYYNQMSSTVGPVKAKTPITPVITPY